MKLKNKIIPLTAIIATTTPFSLTACGGMLKTVNLLEMKEPDFEQYEPTESGYVDQKTATDAYVAYMKRHPKSLVDDLRWGVYQNWLSFYDNSNYAYAPKTADEFYETFNAEMTKLDFSISNPSFGTVKINTPGAEYDEYPTISFKMSMDVEVGVTTIFGKTRDVSTHHNIKCHADAEYRNMLFFAYPATRNDKTHGNGKDPSDMPVDTTKAGWWITISEDSDVQYNYRRNFSDWGIVYNFDFEDEIVKKDGLSGKEWYTNRTAKFGSEVDTYTELEELIGLKTYSYVCEAIPEDGRYNAWQSWFQQEPASVLANCLLLDNVSHYLAKCHSYPYMFVPENLRTTINYSTSEYNLEGAYFYPNDDFKVEDIDSTEIYLDYEGTELYEQSGNYDGALKLSIEDSQLLNVDWESWKTNKGAIPVKIVAHTTTQIDQTKVKGPLNFALENNILKFTLLPASGSAYEGEIKMGDGLGIIYFDLPE